MRAAVIVCSDSVAAGTTEDTTGPVLVGGLREIGCDTTVVVVPDEVDRITTAIRAADAEVVVCTGGTGLGPRDVTPDAVRAVIDRELPGFGEAFRARGRAVTPLADLSRAVAGSMGQTLVVAVPAGERTSCSEEVKEGCTACAPPQMSVRWVMPDVNGTGEMEIDCLAPDVLAESTVVVNNLDSGEVRCARAEEDARFRIGLPSTVGDRVAIEIHAGRDAVTDYASCELLTKGAAPRHVVDHWGVGPYAGGSTNAVESDTCTSDLGCQQFQGLLVEKGTELTAPAEGFGEIRQTPPLRRFIQLAQTALEPGDPISFAPYYSIRPMTDPYGNEIAPHAVVTMNTIGDMNVPLNSGIAFARATGALPFLRPDQAAIYPEWIDFVTPQGLYAALGNRTPNQDLIDSKVVEGITKLARHPAGPECAESANWDDEKSFETLDGDLISCAPTGCLDDPEICLPGQSCDEATDRCRRDRLGAEKCEEALYDSDDLDEGGQRYFERAATVPHRLARYTERPNAGTLDAVWAPRLGGVPFSADGGWVPDGRPLTGLLDAYIVPEGNHTWVNGNPCEAFDHGTYLTNVVARFFQSNGTDLYYLSHPTTHHCLEGDATTCGYLQP